MHEQGSSSEKCGNGKKGDPEIVHAESDTEPFHKVLSRSRPPREQPLETA